MEMTEAKIFEAFGYPEQAAQSAKAAAEAAGAKEQVVAEPAAEGTNADTTGSATEGQQVQQEPQKAQQTGQEAEPTEEPGEDGKQQQTEQQRRENAARRRRQEQQAAVDQAVAQARQAMEQEQNRQWEQFFQQAGFKNSVTGQPIKTKAEYDAWQTEFAQQQLAEQLKKGELTPEALQQVISNNPIVQQAQQLIQQDSAAKQQAQEAAEQQRIQSEIAQITAMNPAIKSVEDLARMPQAEFDAFKGYVDKGYSFLDSYKLSHMEQIVNARAEAARNAALNNARGKDHLSATQNPGGAGESAVPKAQMELYRKLMPKATPEEIQKHWNKYNKGK